MEYTINQLAKLAGVSTRTLRYYDQCGLLPPKAVRSSGYRIYGQAQVDRLQQILFYRELGMGLTEIGRSLAEKDFDRQAALQNHLAALLEKRQRLDSLIDNVKRSIQTMKGEIKMTDEEKFEGFKQKLLADNERNFGDEIRRKYGNEAIDRSNAKLRRMTEERYAELEKLTQEMNDTWKAAFEQGDPHSQLAQKACELHKQWLSFSWAAYSKEAHIGVTQMYVEDPRFTAYYDRIAPGCAKFLRAAVQIFCS
ncbi:MAG: MerR family transcriptional regulator [Clostridium sp.]|jgi:DNA-binding transcriptional MerR regulator|nr:MerR family transcriptional regulator [Clostridium sp.]